MLLRAIFLLTFVLEYSLVQGFPADSLKSIQAHPYSITNPIALPTHPVGIYFLRIADNFSTYSSSSPVINVSLSSGNVWSPPVSVYRPLDPQFVQAMREVPWHGREYSYDLSSIHKKESHYMADGVLKELRLDLHFPLVQDHEISLTSRYYYLSEGQVPMALLTSDRFVEWFHSNVAGGHDPFARRVYGLDKAGIYLMDENGKEMKIEKNSLFAGASEVHYYYYPSFFRTSTFNIKTGAHLSISHQGYNPSMDGGISVALMKSLPLNQKQFFFFGLNPGMVKRRIIKFGEGLKTMEAAYASSFQGVLSFNHFTRKKAQLGLNLTYYWQSPYNKATGDNLIYTGSRVTSHWYISADHFYQNQQTWTLAFSYTKKYSFSLYIQEDFKVNNSPDIQTGIHVGIPIKP